MGLTEELQRHQRVDNEAGDRFLGSSGQRLPFVFEKNVVLDAKGNPLLQVFAIVTNCLLYTSPSPRD